MKRTIASTGILLAALPLAGCFPNFGGEREENWDPAPQTTAPKPTTHPPSVDTIDIADWPPVGPKSAVLAKVSDPDGNLTSVRFSFKNDVLRSASGRTAAISVTGAELGEGFGTLAVTATDSTTARATRNVTDMLVDLTPPKIVLGKTIVPADGELELWVGDAWILGSVELEFAGKSQKHSFPVGFPQTLGTTWDYSLVEFDVSPLPAVAGQATLTAIDAAGNSTLETFTLVIDGEPPNVAITAPADGASITGLLTVELSATDPGGGPVWVELALSGTPIATATGPTATLKLDTSELVAGPGTLVATAIDQAGNRASAARAVVIE